MKKIKVGIVGCGTIGSALAKIVARRFSDSASLAYLSEHHREKAEKLKKALKRDIRFISIPELVEKVDLVIEAACPEVALRVARLVLKDGKSAMIMSVGGLLADESLLKRMGGRSGKIWIPSGAVVGIDGLLAARSGKVHEVKLVTHKPPASLKGAPYFQRKRFPVLKPGRAVCVFQGSAYDAVKAFPQNINVAAVLSLAGIGAKKTKVEIWTSPDARINSHEISVRGDFGEFKTVTKNFPSKTNPKTSALAIQSASALLEKIFSSVQIGT